MEGSSSGTKRRSWPKDQFIDLVFSWSLAEIFDENLYKYQVEKIPESFENVDQYLGSFVFPLLEETRAELASALEAAYKAPFAKVTSFSESKHQKCQYDINVDHWRNRISDRGREPYKTLPGDLVLLSDLKPETGSDLRRSGLTYTLACVKNIGCDDESGGDNLTSPSFNLKTAKNIDVENGEKEPLYVVFLMNMMTNKRIWNGLCLRQNLNIIEKVLSKNDLDAERCQLCSLKYGHEVEEKLEPSLLSRLNESQSKAIFSSLSKIDCHHRSSVELIWGPPGTGKTATLSILLYALLRMNRRTLVCAPTNVAITELASRVASLVRQYSVKAESGNSFLGDPLGEMLLFGNKDRLKFGSDIEKIFLDNRVDILVNCLVPLTGWKNCVASMLDFLEDCVSQHRVYVDNELIKAKATGMQEFNSKSFLEFARDRFPCLATPLKSCMSALSTHLPRTFIREESLQGMVELVSLLESIEMMFGNINMTSEELENIFQQKRTIGSELSDDTSSLMHIRGRCISVLISLRNALDKLGLPMGTNITAIKVLCFQKPSLVFCTTSSSFKLNSVDIKPFNFLVIDEAAQIKECESVIALQIPDVRHAILVGDECQLPATVSSKLSEEAGFGRSLFERLSSLGHSKHLLNVQYRMHPSISRFPNSNFYLNQILDGPNVQDLSYERCYLQGRMFGPYSFINIRGGKEESDGFGHSKRNMVEVAVMLKLVQKLFKAWSDSKEKVTIGLISPYAAQVAAIREKIQHKYENFEGFVVKVKSIDGFQGGEEDIIIISTVRANNGGSIGFLSSPQRTNVALTRARHCLWILGHERTLSESDSVWETLIYDAKHRQCLFNADDDRDIGKSIIDVKKELQELEDLLSGESVLFKDSRWKVLFSDNFRKSFQKLKPPNVKKLVINVLLKVASGWRPKKINVEFTCESCSYVVKQFKVEKYHVVCSTDIIKDSVYQQVLKVWDILPIVETPKLLKRLYNIFAMYTDDFINHCNEKLLEGNLEVPKSWSISNGMIRFKNLNDNKSNIIGSSSCAVESRNYVENSKVSESFLLMKFYTLSAGVVNLLLTDLEGREVDLPFEVTDEEREIIMFPKSSFILGRSGTGKTTILTMKLYRTLQQYCIADDCGASREGTLRQIFVTVSPKLCYAVKKHVSQLKSFASGNLSGNTNFADMDDIDEMAEFKHIPDTFIGIQPEKYPLVITFHKFLMMLDGTLGNSYFERFRDTRDSSQREGGKRSVALQTFIRKNEVTYDRFLSLYWPHFNTKLTKNLDPSRVFTEIMSHIKGGQQEGNIKRSQREYLSLSECRVSTLSVEMMEVIYDIFENYEKMKIARGEFDIADFVMDIHLRLKSETLSGDKMDFVYIDEVQDLTMMQISLFRYICKNVEEGFVFSGDTAQTIARGIDFRFEDIRSLFYSEFVMKSRNDCEETSGRRRKEKGLISDMFSLSHNFRTHAGVLRLAQSVIDLICHFFPESIDVLAPETSLIYGESPVFLEPGSSENSIVTIFGHSGKDGGKWVGFGADQVILVRDDSARKEICNYIGHQALVLTIVECKGLEFQDVLLYNFFGSSPMSNQWRVVYGFLKEKDLLDASFPKSFPSFTQSRHNIMCSELKQLYVAITRTRQRLWICENNVELSKPMFDLWRRLCLVQVRKLDDSLAEAMQRASSPEEWKSQGIKLFWEKNYEMATMCFEKAGDETWEKRAKASGLRAAADSLRGSKPEEAHIMLREAAEIFDSIGRADTAAECFCDLGEYERAGRIYLEKCGTTEKAGECFCLAGRYTTAAEVYAKGNFFNECLSSCTKGKNFDLGLQYIEHWKQQASLDKEIRMRCKEINSIAQEFLEKCAMECHRTKDNTSLMKFVHAFPTIEFKRNFLEKLDLLEELLVLEEESGNFIEAADIAKRLGDSVLEVDLLEKAGKLSKASLQLLSHVLSFSLWGEGGQGWPLKSFPEKEQFLSKAVSLAEKVDSTFLASVSVEAKVLSHEKMKLSELMQCYIASKQHGNRVCEILSIRKILDSHFQVNLANYDEWEPELYVDTKFCDERILRNRVSGDTLIYVWNLWKVQCLEILECLKSLESVDFVSCRGIVEFCLDYFGVRLRHGLSISFLLMNPNAAWVRNVDQRFMMKRRQKVTLESRHFVLAAKKYWREELISSGLRVLEILESHYKCLLMKPLSRSGQSACLICIFSIAKFFVDSKSLEVEKADSKKLNDFLQLSYNYFDVVFPLDPRQSLSETIIYLRGTEASKNLLEEIISQKLLPRKKQALTYGQIGRMVMIMMGSAKLKHDIFQKFDQLVREGSDWKRVIEDIDGIKLHKALKETYHLNYRMEKDYISPNCFFYLVERLLILVPHSEGFFFTAKSSFVEYLVSLQGDASVKAGLVIDRKPSPDRSTIIGSLVEIVWQCICDHQARAEWIRMSRIYCKNYFPLLLLRLFAILFLLCLNSELSFGDVLELPNFPQIISQLPRESFETIRRVKKINLAAVAADFKVMGDPLVIVASSGNVGPIFDCPDAVFLDLMLFSCKNEAMKMLFPPIVRNVAKSLKVPQTSGSYKFHINWSLIREMSNATALIRNSNDGKSKSLFLSKMVEVEEHLNFLTAALGKLEQTTEDDNVLREIPDMIEELKRLCSSLDKSEFEYKGLWEIGDHLKRLEARRPQLDTLLIQNDTANECVDSGGTEVAEIANNNRHIEEPKIEDSAVVAVGNNVSKNATQGSKGKGKKNNKKSRKGKGNRGK